MSFSRDAVEALRRVVDFKDVLVTIGGVNFKDISENSVEIRCPCPIHGGDNPTGFSYNKSEELWTCFTHNCGQNGSRDLFGFVCTKMGTTFSGAVQELAHRYNFDLSRYSDSTSTDQIIAKRLSSYASSISRFRRAERDDVLQGLPGYHEAGWDSVKKYLTSRKYGVEVIPKFNLYPCKDPYGLMRMGIPVYDEDGFLVGVNARLMNTIMEYPEKLTGRNGREYPVPKYRMTKFSKGNILFNLNNAKSVSPTDGLIVVEGQLDAMRLCTYGHINAVCCMGTTLSPTQVSLVCRHAMKVTFLVEEGQAAMTGVLRSIRLLPETLKITVAPLPSGDADSNSREVVEKSLNDGILLTLEQIRKVKKGASIFETGSSAVL